MTLFFAGQQVYVSGNLLIYYVEGDPRRSIAPDVFVVKNCVPRRRRIFKIWEEGKGPHFILEITSSSTKSDDINEKLALSARLGVDEYFLFDPLGEWLTPGLVGYRLVNGEYEPIGGGDSFKSEQLGITFRLRGNELELYDAASGKRLLVRRTLEKVTEEAPSPTRPSRPKKR